MEKREKQTKSFAAAKEEEMRRENGTKEREHGRWAYQEKGGNQR